MSMDTEELHSLSFGSTKRSTSLGSSTTTTTSFSSSSSSNDLCSSFVNRPRPRPLALSDLRFTRRLGSGDMSTVYLAEPKEGSGGALFAAKVMEKEDLARRNKEGRARTECDILHMLDHPFLPTLYASINAPDCLCFLTTFCPGGDLHLLRQRFPNKRFLHSAVRFYASEVLLALEYLHMLGVIYRDLKPENVLIRSDGHIMLTDFDLSLKCDDSASTAQIISDEKNRAPTILPRNDSHVEDARVTSSSSCIIPSCIVPTASCFQPKRKRKKKQTLRNGPAFVAEPINVRSMSFVGTHEYLAPEIVSGEGHGSAVDWWTLGIFMFELFYGVTPFKGMEEELTLANIVARALEFPKEPAASGAMKDLISQLLVKDPAKRLGSVLGASAIKHHSFFEGLNWALLRCTTPPFVPPPTGKPVHHHNQTSPDIFFDCY